MNKLSNTWVFSSESTRLPEVIAAGLRLGEQVSVFVIGSPADIAEAQTLGATTVYYLGEKDSSSIIESYVDTMAHCIHQSDQPTAVILPNSRRGKAMASKLGVHLNAGVFNDAAEIIYEAGAITAKHLVYGGLAIGEERIISATAVLTITNSAFEPAKSDCPASGDVVHVEFIEPKTAIKCLSRKGKEAQRIDLSKAKRVVSVGNGIGSLENIKQVEQFAVLVGAEMGCSRPIAETEKWMDRERYVGVSGVMIKPDVYVAIGISGQIQHMVGVNGSQTIVAINKDKNAPIFQYADYGIVGDIHKILPVLITAFKH